MDRLQTHISKVAQEFDNLLLETQNNILKISEDAELESLARLQDTEREGGILTKCNETKARYNEVINAYEALEMHYDQLQQLYTITEDLKSDFIGIYKGA